MSSFIQTHYKDERPLCAHVGCNRPAQSIHHPHYRCDGGQDVPENRLPLCFKHHVQTHSDCRDWSKWGKAGGKRTASNPWNLRNLKQFQSWPEHKFDEWCMRRMGLIGV